MKRNLKLIVAVMGITVATFSSYSAKAKGALGAGDEVKCTSTGLCGKTDLGQNIDGTARDVPK